MSGGEATLPHAADVPPRRLWSRARAGKLVRFTGSQVIVQAVGFLAGLVIVRTMAQSDYGHYTLAMAMIGLATVLLDLGLGTAIVAVGGEWHAQAARINAVLSDAAVLQRQLAWTAVVLVPAFAAMLVAQGLEATEVAALTALVAAVTALQVRSNLALAVVRLRGGLALQQSVEIGANLLKLALVVACAAVLLVPALALAVNAVAAAAMLAVLRRRLVADIGPAAKASGEFSARLRRLVGAQAPNAIYYCLSGQIAIWLIGALGSAEGLAELGALGRLALLFTIVGAVVTAIVQPYFARAASRAEIAVAFRFVNLVFAAVTLALTGAAMAYPRALLWILGPTYQRLETELVWMVLSTTLASWAGAAYAIGCARGWVLPSTIAIPVGVATLAVAALWLDVSTVAGGFMLNTAVAAVGTVLAVGYVAVRIRRSGA